MLGPLENTGSSWCPSSSRKESQDTRPQPEIKTVQVPWKPNPSAPTFVFKQYLPPAIPPRLLLLSSTIRVRTKKVSAEADNADPSLKPACVSAQDFIAPSQRCKQLKKQDMELSTSSTIQCKHGDEPSLWPREADEDDWSSFYSLNAAKFNNILWVFVLEFYVCCDSVLRPYLIHHWVRIRTPQCQIGTQ